MKCGAYIKWRQVSFMLEQLSLTLIEIIIPIIEYLLF